MIRHFLPLGTNSTIPSFGRQTLATICASDRTAVLLDAGSGVGRLMERSARDFLLGYESLSVILSAYTPDRLAGLFCLAELWQKKLIVYAPFPPPPAMNGALGSTFEMNLWSSVLLRCSSFANCTVVNVLERTFRIDGVQVTLLRYTDPRAPIGIRLDDDLAYITNAGLSPSEDRKSVV